MIWIVKGSVDRGGGHTEEVDPLSKTRLGEATLTIIHGFENWLESLRQSLEEGGVECNLSVTLSPFNETILDSFRLVD